jgi:hypothetical protein
MVSMLDLLTYTWNGSPFFVGVIVGFGFFFLFKFLGEVMGYCLLCKIVKF